MSSARARGPVVGVLSREDSPEVAHAQEQIYLGILDAEGDLLLPRSLPERGGFQGIR
jgi:hypothetical protein